MIHEVFMPALSSTMTEGKIVSWEKSLGDKIEKGETVVIVESDKADMDVESFYEGYLATIIVDAGGVAPVGEAIAFIAETEAEIETAKQQAKSAPAAAAPAPAPAPVAAAPAPVAATARSNGRTIASPRARKLAKDLKVDLATLVGSGPHGRIVAQDVESAAGVAPSVAPIAAPAPVAAPKPVAAPAPAPKPAVTPGQVVRFNTLQQAVIRNMVASLAVPTFHVAYSITTDNLDRLYKQIKSKGVTMTALLAKAVAVVLAKHPIVNAGYTEEGIQYPSNINVAIAVAMDDGGLITPVLQNADRLDIYSLSRTWKDLVARSRSKQLQPVEYNSGTFTLSNLGMFGVDQFDAILPPGQGSILAIGASKPQVVAMDNGLMGVRRQMTVNITCDHRIIYGADAAAFLKDLADLIENNPESLTL
ncbi:MAG: 2-oxo acid dehydrogenase subunit E2 [Roseofilum sp. SBFL]|uniref:dihydrolipoamide acetyltransferase family protein n=1 Tax=unclassified Roseofilum TaxID=2620099 RepID=UPI001B210507|nr:MULTISPECIES: dihydrolipoamide acetyltransferase family protein [unclassified Roseofilum]MBP0015410.1 2-oxo acid dehydrogenase subunit E2 [Roseofilum sp. SID3]MBP0024979.1 2-oxo acid dehydrogenase subunit E2 [Roseofilum sp. SID2]MBP0040230.1 2-oxo acid dehydrogenase subunit E2 [Roseofilum sp. SID1]MBP0043535.1 2-oxo acid dehydrogenase subunit E2 [Roseofilum sp. SBFL]